ncbi:hypothetical protein [uncultured Algibacter sp.]|uniref:hypothetical protein n=1 Tax=uncultured Algibacter sp. TaxID=298659 RepID=UPI0032176580
MNTNLINVTEKLYSNFKKYTIVGDLRSRSCECCVTNEEIKLLLPKQLNDLNDNDIGHFSRSAITTFGDVNDYKHFLPRILELMQKSNSVVLDDFLTFEKLNYSEWKTWKENENKAIKNYFFALWQEVITNEKATFYQIGNVLNIVSKYSGLKEALAIWEKNMTTKSKLFIVETTINGFNYYFRKEIKSELTDWFHSNKVISMIEDEFFKTKDEELATQISIAHNILENRY